LIFDLIKINIFAFSNYSKCVDNIKNQILILLYYTKYDIAISFTKCT